MGLPPVASLMVFRDSQQDKVLGSPRRDIPEHHKWVSHGQIWLPPQWATGLTTVLNFGPEGIPQSRVADLCVNRAEYEAKLVFEGTCQPRHSSGQCHASTGNRDVLCGSTVCSMQPRGSPLTHQEMSRAALCISTRT